MSTIARRRSRRDEEPEEEREERPTRRGRSSSRVGRHDHAEPDEEKDEEPRGRRRGASRHSSVDNEPEDEPRGRRGRSARAARSGSGGFSSYSQKKRSTGSFADDFKVEANKPTLIKLMDAEPFDVYNEHWIDDMPAGQRKSFICLDDEYFADEHEKYHDENGDVACPLCEIGEPARTKSLFNVLDLTNPRKPEVKVWSTPPSVTDIFERMAGEKKTQPLDREDLYFEVTLNKKSNKYSWAVVPVKARDLPEDYGIEPFEADELDSFGDDLFTDRTSVSKIDTYDELVELADSLD